MPLNYKLSKSHKVEETKKLLLDDLASIIENALTFTLNTVKWSSNITPFIPFKMVFDKTDSSIIIPNAREFSNRWSIFLFNRTITCPPFRGKYMVTTYKKQLDNKKNWQQVFKMVDKPVLVFFKDEKKRNLFDSLDPRLKIFVCDNIQARNERSGNCQILAHTLGYYLWNRAINSHDNLINRIEIVWLKSIDHRFVIINRDCNSLLSDYTTWNGWIIDAWRGVKGQASVLHTDDLLSYVADLRTFRPDIILSAAVSSLEIGVFYEINDINKSENIALFKKLDELIHHGKMELVAEKNACVPEDLAAHKSKFFAVRKNIETYPQKKEPDSLSI